MSTATATSQTALVTADRVIADRFGGTAVREAALVALGTAILTGFAQITVPLPFTPVPVSLATLGALAVGTALGMRRAIASAVGYALLGLVGVPVFAGDNTGWAFASFGYVIGYIGVAACVGLFAERGADRRIPSMLGAAVVSSAVVYVFGLAWMIPFTGMSLSQGIAAGLMPFLLGDAVKVAVAGGVFPALNALLGRS